MSMFQATKGVAGCREIRPCRRTSDRRRCWRSLRARCRTASMRPAIGGCTSQRPRANSSATRIED